jgi:putative metal-binding protein
MRSHRTTLSGLVLAVGATVTASAATLTTYTTQASFLAAIGSTYRQENFDGYASGTALTTQVSGLVLSSPNSGIAGALPVQAFSSSGASSPPNLLAGGYVPGNPGLPQVIVIDFVPDVTAFGGSVSSLTPNSATVALKIDFRDQTSQTLTVTTGNGNHATFFGFKSDTRISRVTYTAMKSGQQGYRNYGVDDLYWVATDANPPVCTAVKSIIAGILGFDGTSTDTAPFDTGVASVSLVNGVNVSLTCSAPFPAACGGVPTPSPSASWRVQPTLPGVDGSGTVLATDAAGNSCHFDVTFSAFPGGDAEDLVVCRDTGLVLSVTNPLAADAGQIICSSTPPGAGDPPYPPGYEPSPGGDPFPCTVFTIKSPIHGYTLMTLKKDGDFEPRLRMLYSAFDGVSFPPFTDVTLSVDQVATIVPDPTRSRGGGTWSQVKIACAIQAELCNGIDDDHDGLIDEGFPVGGPAIDCDHDGYPQCATTATTATDCNGATVPLISGAQADCNDQIASINAGASEVCNGLDDNCNGQIDEGNPEGGQACAIPGLIGACAEGVTSCANGPMTCQQVTFPVPETCNGLDDNCDGQIDEGNPSGGGPCTVTGLLGVCAAGQYSCADGPRTCVQTVFPSTETCNGLDDDCDGSVDEDLGSTSCGLGACHVTVDNCVAGVPQTCVPGTPSTEVCNGIDDDCDGSTDEDLGRTSCGVGACAASVDNCVGGVTQTCHPGTPATEVCNGIDDDCDGSTDEDLGRTSCGVGACATSVDNCIGGVPQTCHPLAGSTEVCNGIDDDCDGATDEDLGRTTCGVGACATSVDNCVGGVPQTCVPGAPSVEICNGIDDDCDGSIDEGWNFGGYLSPVRADGSGIYQYGRTIPFKFRLTDCAGVEVTNAVATLEVIPYSNQVVGTVVTNLPNLKADTGNTYTYDAKAHQYTYNLGSRVLASGRSYIIRTHISDGSAYDVIISIR